MGVCCSMASIVPVRAFRIVRTLEWGKETRPSGNRQAGIVDTRRSFDTKFKQGEIRLMCESKFDDNCRSDASGITTSPLAESQVGIGMICCC